MKHNRWLLHLALALLVAVAAPVGLLAQDDGSNGEKTHGNFFVYEPVLLYEVSGGFITGPSLTMVTVLTDGHAIRVEHNAQFPDGNVCEATLPVQRIRALERQLAHRGALSLPDRRAGAADLPLTTVTFIQHPDDTGAGVANSFSYFVPIREYLQVQRVIDRFVSEAFSQCD